MFRVCQFTAIGGRVDVKHPDWGLAAKFQIRHAFASIAVMLHQYLCECPPYANRAKALAKWSFLRS